MSEISKLRARMKNVRKSVTEYRMTVTEAKELLREIDILLEEKPQQIVVLNEPAIRTTQILDGGAFEGL